MLSLGPLAFAAPWALAALAALPAIWWLLRLTPPAPLRVVFPPLRILAQLTASEETSAKSPPWLIFLRLALAAALILGLSGPVMNASQPLRGSGPLLVVVDDGWAAARDWPTRRAALSALLDQTAREDRPLALVTTAPAAPETQTPPIQLARAEDLRARIEALQPKPWPADRQAALERIRSAPVFETASPGEIVWLSDGLEDETTDSWLEGLDALGPVRVLGDAAGRPLTVLRPPEADGTELRVRAERAAEAGDQTLWLQAHGADGTLLQRQPLEFPADAKTAEATLDLPTELRNRLTRLSIEDQNSAAAVVLLDERWRRRPVGLVTGDHDPGAEPLLREFYYVARALDPFTEVRTGTADDLLKRGLAVLVMGDSSPMGQTDAEAVTRWVDSGGVLLRFAGPRLADAAGTPALADLLPVLIRPGTRSIGGALSWGQPAKLAPFPPESPFGGLAIPGDVNVFEQVLAQPSLDLADRTWARLADGTPLITAMESGRGLSILVHTSANTTWSNLAISGLFVDLLRRVVGLSRGAVAGKGEGILTPFENLDGFGRLGSPPPGAVGIAAAAFDGTPAGPAHPPGFYGKAESRRALNLSAQLPSPAALGALPDGVAFEAYGKPREIAFRPWLLGLAMALFLIDLLAALALRGLLRPRPLSAAAVAGLALIGALHDARAQSPGPPLESLRGQEFAETASLDTRLAFVLTYDDQIDNASRTGLTGLSIIVNRRTAVDLADPVGIDLESDELLFFPFLYWPITEIAPPSFAAAAKVRDYLDGGGVILFDARDPAGAVSMGALRDLAERLRIPPLIPVPQDHVLSRSYYLLRDFPGRWTGGDVWIEKAGERINDGVSPVIVGSNDWAGAWAVDETQRPLFPVVPGGERQREMAYRFGINLVMYTLTGNYKADQVHLPAILDRLGL